MQENPVAVLFSTNNKQVSCHGHCVQQTYVKHCCHYSNSLHSISGKFTVKSSHYNAIDDSQTLA